MAIWKQQLHSVRLLVHSYFLINAATSYEINLESLKKHESRADGLYKYKKALEEVEKNLAVWDEKMVIAGDMGRYKTTIAITVMIIGGGGMGALGSRYFLYMYA